MAMESQEAPCKVIHAGPIAQSVLEEVCAGLCTINRAPLLVAFLANADPAARKYADWTGRTCREKYDRPPSHSFPSRVCSFSTDNNMAKTVTSSSRCEKWIARNWKNIL